MKNATILGYKMWKVLRSAVLKGYKPPDASIATSEKLELYVNTRQDVGDPLKPSPLVDMLVLLPTVLSRCSRTQTQSRIRKHFDALRASSQKYRTMSMVAIQCEAGEWDEAVNRVSDAVDIAREHALEVLFLISTEKGKVASINAALNHCRTRLIPLIGWMDDDVEVGSSAFLHLADALFQGHCSAVGALKVPHPRKMASSRLLHWAKLRMHTPNTRYPHGCCYLAYVSAVGPAIPGRYVCEDGYLCFHLLRPNQADPMALMKVIPEATCHHLVGSTWTETYFRIRRSLLSVIIFCCDFPPATTSFYLRKIQFAGLWPFGVDDASATVFRRCLKWHLKSILFSWFVLIGVELIIRGLFSRPLREISWSAYRWDSPDFGG